MATYPVHLRIDEPTMQALDLAVINMDKRDRSDVLRSALSLYLAGPLDSQLQQAYHEAKSLIEVLEAALTVCKATEADDKARIAELTAEIAALRPTIKTAKDYKPRNPHSKGCKEVYEHLYYWPKKRKTSGLTSFELSEMMHDAPNNIAARLKDLHVAGYVERTGEQRQGKRNMTDVWSCVAGVKYIG